MPESSIQFFFEDTEPFELDSNRTNTWLQQITQERNFTLGEVSYIFCSDNYLLDINKSYLNHDYFTDIITFDNSEQENLLEGDLFISIERVNENAKDNSVNSSIELRRVMAHGLLHLMGLKDKTSEQISEMRKSEEACLSLWEKIQGA